MLSAICTRRGARDGQPWISNDERDANGLFVREAALFVEAVLSVEVSMVAGENDDGVIERAFSLERREDASQAVIDAQQHLEAPSDFLVGRGRLRAEGRQAVDLAKERWFSERRFERVRAPRHRAAGIAPAVALGGHESSRLTGDGPKAPVVALNHIGMNRFVSQVHEERLIGGTVDESLDVVGEQVGRVPLGLYSFTIDIQRRVDGFPLPWHGNPVVEPWTRAVVVAHVPLAEEAGAVTGTLELQREHPQVVAGSSRIVDDAVGVRRTGPSGSSPGWANRGASWRRRS